MLKKETNCCFIIFNPGWINEKKECVALPTNTTVIAQNLTQFTNHNTTKIKVDCGPNTPKPVLCGKENPTSLKDCNNNLLKSTLNSCCFFQNGGNSFCFNGQISNNYDIYGIKIQCH